MNFLNLEYFIVTAEELNFTRAANRLFIAQQSLSSHIAKLEEYFGIELFDRTPPITLTPAGACLYENAKKLIQLRRQTEQQLQDIKDFRSGSLTIAIARERGSIYLPLILPEFHRRFPSVKLNLLEGTTEEIQQALDQGKTDITIGFTLSGSSYCSETICQERMVVVVPHNIMDKYLPRHGSWKPEAFRLDLLKDCPFLAIHHTMWAGKMFLECCKSVELTPNIILESRNTVTLISLCLAGMGILVCPQTFLHVRLAHAGDETWQGVSVFPLEYQPTITDISINYLKNKYLQGAAKEFIQVSKECLKQTFLVQGDSNINKSEGKRNQ